jgi:hypothetical protein
MIHKAKDLSAEQRRAIESLLGRAIAGQEEISIRALPETLPVSSERRRASLKSYGSTLPPWMRSAGQSPPRKPTRSSMKRSTQPGLVSGQCIENPLRRQYPGQGERELFWPCSGSPARLA